MLRVTEFALFLHTGERGTKMINYLHAALMRVCQKNARMLRVVTTRRMITGVQQCSRVNVRGGPL